MTSHSQRVQEVEDTGSLRVSSVNSSTTPLANAGVFTGEWEDVSSSGSVTVAVTTDQPGSYSIQFSSDKTNIDSSLMRYHKDGEIHAPHRFTVTRRYFRVVYTNNSGSDQTYFRLQTLLGDRQPLNAPLDGTLAQDFDAVVTRPTDPNDEIALGLRQGNSLWNKWGYNKDIDIGTEVVAAFGGTFTPLTTATTLTIASTSTDDDDGGTGVNSIVVYGIDANREEQTEVITMNGTTNVVTTSTWLGINRVAIYLAGTGKINAGTITVTATTGGSTMANMPVGEGVTQQCIFHIPVSHRFLAKWLWINVLNNNKNATLNFKLKVYSAINNATQNVFDLDVDTSKVTEPISVNPSVPFPIGESSVMWLECTSDTADISVNARFSGQLYKDVDA